MNVAVRYVLGLALGIVILLLLANQGGELAAAGRQLRSVDPGWVLAGVIAEALSLATFGLLQHQVLRLAGARVGLADLVVLSVANNAIASTIPGEPAVSSAYRYHHYRRSGVGAAGAGWTIFTVFIAQAIGMSSVLLLGVIVALTASPGGRDAGVAALGLIVIVGGGAILVRRDLVLRLFGATVRGSRRLTGHPRGDIGARIESTLARMREIPLSGQSTAQVVVIAGTVWAFDFAALLCGFGAVHAAVPWQGMLLAYGAAQVVGSLPVVPGGIGIVEGGLAVILAAYGAGKVPALSAALVFRFISYWLPIAVGWITVGLIAARWRRGDRREAVLAQRAGLEIVTGAPPEGQIPE